MVLVIDNYDSFTYNLVQYLGVAGAETHVVRNDQIDVDQVLSLAPSGILLSPGPCTPDRSGVCVPILHEALNGRLRGTPVFGVCLGHQAIGLVGGGSVQRAGAIVHGKTSMVEHDGLGLLKGMPNPFRAVRYHSLVIAKTTVPDGFVATAWSQDDGEVMGVRHHELPVEGVQFHPESILTDSGLTIVRNFVDSLRTRSAA